ncbi:hypothetical protein Ait01nite_051600 [Actinoplanes italicus]|uniref:ABC-2 type transport system permease protein n=1 Tax=Actinoplanes italicus TaxID=113567 RepID=A0A2T0K019_9ACTN|nr:hypothetical protein [Actinoplanes italicus]PRX16127.1 hypothetical protein CLV67_121176 [Actinoplanes italicus]GIE32115.1 hypothetical protein Ait01nite_051600 [Actinoplanes italicus]
MTRLLASHMARAMPWWTFAVAVLLAVVLQLPAVQSEPRLLPVLIGLRLAAAVLGAAVGFALPDLMASTVVTPVARWRRQWLRIAVPLVPAVLVWAGLYLAVRQTVAPAVTWPDGFVILQAAVCGLLPVAAAAMAARYRDDSLGGLAGPMAQGVALIGTLFFVERSSPWQPPATTDWTTAQRCWPVALVLVVVVLLAANRETFRAARTFR